MLDSEREFIRWLAKRLVFKYHESEDLLVKINNILDNDKKNIDTINNYIAICVKNLSDINKFYNFSPNKTKNININSTNVIERNSYFENLDIDQIFK